MFGLINKDKEKYKNIYTKKTILLYAASFLIAVSGILFIFTWLRVYPLGDNSILYRDLSIQYVDFFEYYRKVLLGMEEFAYSFSKGIGGPMISLIGYYLMSPFNLLLVFFNAEEIPLFIFIITVLKVGTCSLTSAIFLRHRFSHLGNLWILLISFAYAMMQYNIAQMHNIMWLDGVYMLPLMMLAVWNYLQNKKKIQFSISVAFCILFNWYTAYMNCLFIILYFGYELLSENENKTDIKIKKVCKCFFDFFLYEGLGVLLVSFFFLPVIIGLRNGKGNFSTEIFQFRTNGSFLEILRGFVLGTPEDGQITFFCGSFLVICALLFFLTKEITSKQKIYAGVLLGAMVFSSFFKPLENIWNGLREAHSYFCRFSYLVIVVILLLAATYLEKIEKEERKKYIGIVLGMVFIYLALDYVHPFDSKKLWAEIIILLALLVCLLLKATKKRRILICLITMGELIISGYLVASDYYNYKYEDYKEYVRNQNEQIKLIEQNEKDLFYRMEQTRTREFSERRVSALLDESLAYGNRGIGHYSSGLDQVSAEFISNLGYSDMTEITIYNEPILTSDSFLGVKYLLADIPFAGWEKLDGYNKSNEKEVYYNENALGLAMKCNDLPFILNEESNPFVYQNNLYSELLGRKVELFKKAEYDLINKEDDGIEIEISPMDVNGILYGYGQFNQVELELFINNKYRCNYQTWLGYLVFNIGTTQKENKVYVKGDIQKEDIVELEMYYLDMDMFEEVISELKNREANIAEFSDEKIVLTCEASNTDELLTTIPYDAGWKAKVNGKYVEIEKKMDALISIPLTEGDNTIVLTYHIQGVKEGIILSLLAVTILLGIELQKKKRRIQ